MCANDPWADTEPKWERYAGRDGGASVDGFTPLDTRAGDLAAYLRAEIDLRSARPEESQTMVRLPNGTHARLTQKSADEWELMVHLGRDFYKVITARTQEQVLAGAV